jgi:hypothetical protein
MKPASGPESHCSDKNALFSLENIGCGRPLEYVYFLPIGELLKDAFSPKYH